MATLTVAAVDTSNTIWKRPLSPRQAEAYALFSRGLSRKEVASRMRLSLSTIKQHRRNILKKAAVPNCASLSDLWRRLYLTMVATGPSRK